MSGLLGEGSIFSALGTTSGATTAAIAALIFLAMLLIVKITGLPIVPLIMRVIRWVVHKLGKTIRRAEEKYHRDLAVGKIDAKRKRVKLYRFLNDLIIDLQLKRTGIVPYEFLFIVVLLSFTVSMFLCKMLFGSTGLVIVLFPIITVGAFCVLYTRANVAHDYRIEAVIEAENIICNNIKEGVTVAVKNSIDVIPLEVRDDFRDYVDNVELKNYHSKTALMELNGRLGNIADDFIKKAIVFELEEEKGIANMFKDIVEMNNIKMEIRINMKRKFEEAVNAFIVSAIMIVLFFLGVLVIYKDVREFYFKTPIGQIILCLDALIMIVEYVYITYLRAQEL